ncbi:class I SAM-dependent methyltransferase [Streptomyces sp. 6N223]|uniref:class I SAM-dependent methyltransferase n=1 Tax=Streptomyces sp. 6N223 TaxID=3457412 RepID=UPI003FD4B230
MGPFSASKLSGLPHSGRTDASSGSLWLILAIDRSAKAISQAKAASAQEIASGRMSVRHVAAEHFALEPGEAPFDIVFAVRVGALDGRHPEAGRRALDRIAAALAPGGRLFIDGGEPLREIPMPTRH